MVLYDEGGKFLATPAEDPLTVTMCVPLQRDLEELGSHTSNLEASNCDILRYHDSRIMTYQDYENYPDCHILQTFGTNKQAVVYINHVTVLIFGGS